MSNNPKTTLIYRTIRESFSIASRVDNNFINTINKEYNDILKHDLLKICETKKYTPFLADLFIRLNIDKNYWSMSKNNYSIRNYKILNFTNLIFEKIKENNLENVFLYENFGALLSSSNDFSMFGSGDIDILSDPKNYAVLSGIFKNSDFVEEYSNVFDKKIRTTFKGTIDDFEFRINVMFYPIVRYKLPLLTNLTFEKTQKHSRNFKNIVLPSKEHLFYLSCLRISAHTYVRSPDYRLYYEILLLLNDNVDLDYVKNIAIKDNNLIRVSTVFEIMKKIYRVETNYSFVINKKITKNLKIIFNNEQLSLKLTRKKFMFLELNSYGSNIIKSIFLLLFPKREWIKHFYSKNNKYLKGLIRYYRYILKG